MRRMPVEYSTSRMARSRSPIGSSMSQQLHDPLDLLGGEDVLGQGAAQPGQLQLGGRVVQDVILPRHPTEPHAQGDEARVLRPEAQRLAVLLAVVEEMPLIPFEHWPRDLDRLRQPALPAPLEEEADVDLTIAYRVRGVVLHGQRVQMIAHHRLQRRLRAGASGLRVLRDAGHHFTPAMVRT